MMQYNKIYFYSGVNRNSCVELNKKIGLKTSKKGPGAPVIGIPPSIKLLSGFNHNCLETLGCFFRSYLRMAAFSILETP